MADILPNVPTHVKELGTVDLDPSRHFSAYKETVEIFNFTGEPLLYCNTDGAVFNLPSDSHAIYNGQIVVRKEIRWRTEVNFKEFLPNKKFLTPEVSEALEAYYLKAASNKNIDLPGGYHSCMYDVVLNAPSSKEEHKAYKANHPDVIFGVKDGLRTIKLLHNSRCGNGKSPQENIVPVGVVVKQEDYTEDIVYVQLHGIYVKARPIRSAAITIGAIVCLLTGSVIHTPEEGEGNTMGHFVSILSAIGETMGKYKNDFKDRELTYQSVEDESTHRRGDREHRLKTELSLELHDLKRRSLITDMASSRMVSDNKIAIDNAKTILGAVTNIVKR